VLLLLLLLVFAVAASVDGALLLLLLLLLQLMCPQLRRLLLPSLRFSFSYAPDASAGSLHGHHLIV
jgi:hypothetical protein